MVIKTRQSAPHILLNNSQLGKISKEQRAGEWEVWQTSLHNPDFSEFAKLCGGFGIRVEESGKLESAITEALAYPGPALVEIISDADLV
jgi:thiamine pyrophosphate-dependent acetolactate synthase large subunit-like protein